MIAKILMLLPKLQAQHRSLDELIADLKQPAETQEIRFELMADEYRGLGESVIEAFRKGNHEGWTLDSENEEGVRFTVSDPYGSGWFLLRMSLHEPLLVLQVENDQPNMLRQVLAEFPAKLQPFPQVNQAKLTAYLGN